MESSRPHPPTSRPAARTGATPPPTADFWLERYSDERSTGDRLRMRVCIAVASLVHVALFVVTFPALSESEPPPEDRVWVYALDNSVPKPPDPEPVSRQTPPEAPPEIVIPVPQLDAPDIVEREPAQPIEPFFYDTPTVLVEVPEAPPAPAADRPIRFGRGMTRPVKISGPTPAYTETARRARMRGVVILQAVIDERGDVTELKVLKSLPFGLTESALRAVGQWRFEPSTLSGRPVAVLYNLTIRFELN